MGGKAQGTDSHRTISKRSSECWLLIGHKKCFVLLCPIDEQFLLSSFREFVHDGYNLATVSRFVHKAFLTRNKGPTTESKNVSDTISICTEKILSLANHNVPGIVNNRKFMMQRQRESKKSKSLTSQNNNLARASRFLYFSLPPLHDYHVRMPNFTFCH